MADDSYWMARALAAGRRSMGATGANPAVGCVVVRDGVLAGIGWTAVGGRPHAEPQALAMAGEAARGATAYVSLEPCCHHGATPPCTDALIAAGVARVVTALEDPDPRVRGGGHAALQAAGIAVTAGVLAEEAARDLAGFISRNTRNRPHVILKLAVSADGKIAERAGAPTAVTGPAVKDRVHLMRARADAVLVGVSTVVADDPELTCRLPGLAARSPVRVVADSRLSTPPGARLVTGTARVPPRIATVAGADDPRAAALRAAGADLLSCPADAAGRVDLVALLAGLAGRGINAVLAEGGARLARSLVEAGLVDEVALFCAPRKLGPGAVDALAGLPLDTIRASRRFRPAGRERVGEDRLERYLAAR